MTCDQGKIARVCLASISISVDRGTHGVETKPVAKTQVLVESNSDDLLPARRYMYGILREALFWGVSGHQRRCRFPPIDIDGVHIYISGRPVRTSILSDVVKRQPRRYTTTVDPSTEAKWRNSIRLWVGL